MAASALPPVANGYRTVIVATDFSVMVDLVFDRAARIAVGPHVEYCRGARLWSVTQNVRYNVCCDLLLMP